MSERPPLYPLTDPAAIAQALETYDEEGLRALYISALHDRSREAGIQSPTTLWSEERPAFYAWKNRLATERATRSLQAHPPLLYRGDRIAFSVPFLETALQEARQHPERRTLYAEVDVVATNPDGSKIVGVRKNRCPVCTRDLDESPHEVTACPALKVPEV